MPTLDDINYIKHEPDGPLAKYVQALWIAYKPDNTQRLSYDLLSDCGSCIIMNFSEKLVLKRHQTEHKVRHEMVIVGPSASLFNIRFENDIFTVGINFHPAAGEVFIKGGIAPLIDSIETCQQTGMIELDTFYRHIASEKHKNTIQHNLLFEQLEALLNKKLEDYQQSTKQKITKMLELLKLDIPNDQLAQACGISERELQRRFKQYVGISPRVYQRIMKLNKIKTTLSDGEFDNLTQIALDNGYYDQAHFIRDFKSFMQRTPKQYYRQKKDS